MKQNKAYIALLAGRTALQGNQTGQEVAHSLVEESRDILALSLDKEVGAS